MCLKCVILLSDGLDLFKNRVTMNSDIASILRLDGSGPTRGVLKTCVYINHVLL